MTDKLKPCPFCGSTEILIGNDCVYCANCSANTDVQGKLPDGSTKAEAAWSTRASDARIERLEKALRHEQSCQLCNEDGCFNCPKCTAKAALAGEAEETKL